MTERIDVQDFFGNANHKLVVRDIFAMYHHNWDIIGESVQNAVDSVLEKAENASEDYKPTIEIEYDARVRAIAVRDNGIGVSTDRLKQIVSPHVSFKNALGATRGEFGVGLAYLAFSSNDFRVESVSGTAKGSVKIKNGYSWAMDDSDQEQIEILYDSENIAEEESYTKLVIKPVRFPEYTLQELEYILRRHTAVGDFWTCFKSDKGPTEVQLTYTGEDGETRKRAIENKFWHPADFFDKIQVETVDWATVRKEVDKGKEYALPNWIGFGLVDRDTITEQGKEFAYYALFCRTQYYKQLAQSQGLFIAPEDDEEVDQIMPPAAGHEALATGIFVLSKKGMPLGAVVNHPRTAQAGYWRAIFIMINCDSLRTEPGRKKLHVDDEMVVAAVAKQVFYRLTEFSHYIIPRDPDEEIESLLRNVDKNLEIVKAHRQDNKLSNPRNKIQIYTDPLNEQTVIALFHELVGAGILSGYTALKLSATETYDGIYEYEIPQEQVGREHWQAWLRSFPARERKRLEKSGLYRLDTMIVEFKMHLENIIKDFLQKTKYHPQIKLIVAWDANRETIKKRGWLLEDLPQPKQKFYGARWRLRPSSEGQARGILATDVLLLKDFLEQGL